MARYFYEALKEKGLELGEPIDEQYMYVIESEIDGEAVSFFMGKNDEESTPGLWQVWPEQKIGFFAKILGRVNTQPEQKAKLLVEQIAREIEGVTGVEWGI